MPSKPTGNPPAPVQPAADFDFAVLDAPTLQPTDQAAPAQSATNSIDSPAYVEAAKFSLGQNGDLSEVYARFAALAADVAADKIDTKTALLALAQLGQTAAAVSAVKAEGLLSEIEQAGGIDDEDLDDIVDFLGAVRDLAEAKKIIFTGAKEKDEFMAKLEKAEEAIDNYLDDEDEGS